MVCWPARRARRTFVWTAPLLLVATLVTGCEQDSYPADLRYPARTDVLVIDKPKEDVPETYGGYDRPGDFPGVILAGLPEDAKKSLILDPANLSDKQHTDLEGELSNRFGTPANPTADIGDTEVAAMLKLDPETLKRGSAIYRQQCLHCHGLSGDGRGATAPWVNPHPRDYRQGVFKFTSSSQNEGERKPRRYDLLRTLREGIEGTSMPSFRLLPEEDLEALASYVIHLSMRGEIEFSMIKNYLKDEGNSFSDYLGAIVSRWKAAQSSMINPPAYPGDSLSGEAREKYLKDSIERGFKIFSLAQPQGNIKSGGCLGCHADFGRRAAYKYDTWGTIVRPADVTTGMYRGGRRPLDLYWRVHSGINGVTMPASISTLSPEEVWDVVNFLQVLPYPKMREKYGIRLEQSK
ncbi:MAG TPA: c-type cytochrome [Gemmataceae bacterium]|nr:c-type cytochrome [Gemmataceae bacterium]